MTGLIAHEWLEPRGGAEHVVEGLSTAFPGAHLYCLWNDDPARFPDSSVRESWLAKTPLRSRKALALPVMSRTWRSVDVRGYDFVIVSSHTFAHHVGVRSPKRARPVPTFVYTHSPARYLWAPEVDNRARRAWLRPASVHLRRVDRRFAGHGAAYAANSYFVQKRVRRAWGIDAPVIYPPVDIPQLSMRPERRQTLTTDEQQLLDSLPDRFILGASRFVPYKRLDLVVRFANEAGLPVVLAGGGPLTQELSQLVKTAGTGSRLIVEPTTPMLHALYQRADTYVFPAIEDFGIMPVEAMALGTPVVVNAVGGAAESVRALQGGVTFNFLDWSATKRLLDAAKERRDAAPGDSFDMFSARAFVEAIQQWVGASG